MSTGSGGKPGSGGSQPGRPAADTPQRLVVRSDADTAVAMAQKKSDLGMEETGVSESSEIAGSSSSEHKVTSSGGSGATAMPEVIGTTLSGRYLVTRKIGQGGMGAVYE